MVKILFFGITREITGKSECNYDAGEKSALIMQLMSDYPELQTCRFRISVNGVINEGNIKLNDNDVVALLPPFAGG